MKRDASSCAGYVMCLTSIENDMLRAFDDTLQYQFFQQLYFIFISFAYF